MKNRKLKRSVIYGLYALSFIAFFGAIYLIESNVSVKEYQNKKDIYVTKTIFDDTVSVVASEKKLVRPYNNTELSILKNYYSKDATEDEQRGSIIYYENTYMQSSGISYGGKDDFDVVAVYDGTVLSVSEDKLLGATIKIKHSDDVISIYQSLKDVIVKENDKIQQGQILGTSGTSTLESDLGQHVYFELLVKEKPVNPENSFGKTLSEL